MDSMAGAQSELCFSFSSDKIRVDWRRINAVNIDLLVRQVDIDALQEHIRDVTFCSLETVRCTWCLTPVDPTLVKLFRLAQLSLEWLHHCQEKLISSLRGMEDKVKSSDTECKKLQAKSKEQEQKMKRMVSELKARRNIIQKQQSMFAKYMRSSVQCQHCDKKYINGFFLQEHMLRRHPSQCQNLTHQIGQKDSEIESLKLEISSLRTQMAQTAEEQNQRLQQEVWKVQQGKMQLHIEKETLQLEKSKMQMETENLQKENLRLKQEVWKVQQGKMQLHIKKEKLQLENSKMQMETENLQKETLRLKTENLRLQHETLDMQTNNVRLQQEKVELQKGKEELQKEAMASQAENLKLQQEKLQLVMEKGKLQQGILEVREEAVNLQQENLTLESKNSKLKAERKEQRRQQGNERKPTVKISSKPVPPKKTSTATPAKVSRMYHSSSSSLSFSNEESETKGDDSEQETEVKKQPVNQKCDLSQELGEDRQRFPSHPQLRTNSRLTGDEKGEPGKDQSLSWSWWEAAQYSLPSTVIQVKPAATDSQPRSQPVEPDRTPTASPKKASAICPSYFPSNSSEESEAEGDHSEQLTDVSETSQLQASNKLTGNKEEEPDNEPQDFRSISEVAAESSLAGREAKTQPGVPPKKVSFLQEKNLPLSLNKKKRRKEPQKVVRSQTLCQDRQTLPSCPQPSAGSETSQLLTQKNKFKGLLEKVFGKKPAPKGGNSNSAERIVEVQRAKTRPTPSPILCQQKQLKGIQNITPGVRGSAASGQVSQLQQKAVGKYSWFHKHN